MCFDENRKTEYPLYLYEDAKGNTEIIGRRGRKVRRVEMGGGLPEGGAPYQQLVTDGEGVAKWEDRLAYEGELLAVNSHLDAMMYRVADVPATLPAEGDSVTIWLKYGENTMSRDEVVSAEKEDGTFEEDGYISIMQNSAVIALRDNVAVLMTNGEYTHPFPKKGVYFFGSDTGYVSGIAFSADATAPEIEWDGQTSIVKPIDPKYLPEGVGGGAQTNQLVIHADYDMNYEANMTYAGIIDTLYSKKPLHGVIVEIGASDSSGIAISPITDIIHMSSESAEIPYIQIMFFRWFDMERFSLYMAEDNAIFFGEPGQGEDG